MPSVLAVVAKAIFEKRAKGLAVGDVRPTDAYASTNAALDALAKDGALYLVTVRPNDVLWLVAILSPSEVGRKRLEERRERHADSRRHDARSATEVLDG